MRSRCRRPRSGIFYLARGGDVGVASVVLQAVAHHHDVCRQAAQPGDQRLVVPGQVVHVGEGRHEHGRRAFFVGLLEDAIDHGVLVGHAVLTGEGPCPDRGMTRWRVRRRGSHVGFGEPGTALAHRCQRGPCVRPAVQQVHAGRVPDEGDHQLGRGAFVGGQQALAQGTPVRRLEPVELEEVGGRRGEIGERGTLVIDTRSHVPRPVEQERDVLGHLER